LVDPGLLENILNITLCCIVILLLFFASVQDIKAREVVDWIWIVMGLSGISILVVIVIFQLIDGFNIQNFLLNWIWNLIFAIIIVLFLTFTSLGGEADRIAFFVLGLISHNFEPIFESYFEKTNTTPVSVFSAFLFNWVDRVHKQLLFNPETTEKWKATYMFGVLEKINEIID